MKRTVGCGRYQREPPERSGLKAVLSETDEDHLRVALIQPGSNRYLHNGEVIHCSLQYDNNKGGTA